MFDINEARFNTTKANYCPDINEMKFYIEMGIDKEIESASKHGLNYVELSKSDIREMITKRLVKYSKKYVATCVELLKEEIEEHYSLAGYTIKWGSAYVWGEIDLKGVLRIEW